MKSTHIFLYTRHDCLSFHAPSLLTAVLAPIMALAQPSDPPGIVSLEVVSDDAIPLYERFEMQFRMDRNYENPFDPTQVQADLLIETPDGHSWVHPAFWWQSVEVSNPSYEQYRLVGEPAWRARFSPRRLGTYTVRVRVADAGGTVVSEPLTLSTVNTFAPTSHGFVQVDERNSRYLRYDDATPYHPIGYNVSFEDGVPSTNGTAYYQDHFGILGGSGANWSRLWMTDFNRGTLEWTVGHFAGWYRGLGRYALQSAARNDLILEIAEEHGIAIQLVLNDHGQFSSTTNARWNGSDSNPGNPYNAKNGGPVPQDNPLDFFSNEQARSFFKHRLRYLVARYGAYRSLLAWELFNEVQFVGTSSRNPRNAPFAAKQSIADWHSEMAAYLHEIDIHHHPVTTSSDVNLPFFRDIWADPGIDLVQIHDYSSPPERRDISVHNAVQRLLAETDKPTIAAEFGLGASGNLECGFDPETYLSDSSISRSYRTEANRAHLLQGTHLHNAIWSAALSESGAMIWWWGCYLHQDADRNRNSSEFPLANQHLPALARFMEGEDWAPLNPQSFAITASGRDIVSFGLVSDQRAWLWVRDRENAFGTGLGPGDLEERVVSGETIQLEGLDPSYDYTVELWDTYGRGGIHDASPILASGDFVELSLPDFQRDVAIKVYRSLDPDPTPTPPVAIESWSVY